MGIQDDIEAARLADQQGLHEAALWDEVGGRSSDLILTRPSGAMKVLIDEVRPLVKWKRSINAWRYVDPHGQERVNPGLVGHGPRKGRFMSSSRRRGRFEYVVAFWYSEYNGGTMRFVLTRDGLIASEGNATVDWVRANFVALLK